MRVIAKTFEFLYQFLLFVATNNDKVYDKKNKNDNDNDNAKNNAVKFDNKYDKTSLKKLKHLMIVTLIKLLHYLIKK